MTGRGQRGLAARREIQLILVGGRKPITVGREATGDAAGAVARCLATRLEGRLPEPPVTPRA